MSYCEIDLGQNLVEVMAPCLRYQCITCTNADFSFVRFSGIHMRAILKRVLQLLICIMSLASKPLKLLTHPPGVNEFKNYICPCYVKKFRSDDHRELNGDKWVLFRITVWCHQAPNWYLTQRWPSFYVVTWGHQATVSLKVSISFPIVGKLH